MNKILKILSILVIGFVMFSCSTPTNDPTLYVPEESGPETPVETPSDDPVEETPEVQTYSITFIAKNPTLDQPIADLLNSLPDYKNLEEGTEIELPIVIYGEESDEEYTIDLTESSAHKGKIYYEGNYEGNITPMLTVNEDIKIKFWADDFESL